MLQASSINASVIQKCSIFLSGTKFEFICSSYNINFLPSCGGNLLMNIGPSPSGVIQPIYEERLEQMGDWLAVNKEAIFSTEPWQISQNDSRREGTW